MFGVSFYGLSVIWYKVESSTCYIFRHFFFVISSVKLLQILRLLQILLLYYYYSNFFPLTQQKETFEKCGTQTRISLFWRHKRRCSTETLHFTVSQFLNNFPDLPLFTSLVFSNDRWNLPALFVDNCQMLLNNKLPLVKAGNSSLASNKLRSILQAILTLVFYPIIFVASIECTNSSFLTGKNTFCNTLKIMWFKQVGLISKNGSGFLSEVESNLFKYQSTM